MTRAGFTLIEVIVALVLLSVGVLGVASSGLLALRMVRAARVQDEIVARSSFVLDSLVADSVRASGVQKNRWYSIDWIGTGDSAAVTVRTADSASFTMRAIR